MAAAQSGTQEEKPPAHAVRCLSLRTARRVWLIQRPGEEQRVLRWWSLGFKGWLGWITHLGPAHRHGRGTRRLEAAGVRTPHRLAGPRVARRNGRWVVEIESAYVPGPMAIEAMLSASLSAEQKRRCAESVGELVAKLARARLYHRDLSLLNIVVGDNEQAWMLEALDVRRSIRHADEVGRMLVRLAHYHQVKRAPRGLCRWVLRRVLAALPPRRRLAVRRRLRRGL